MLPGALVVAVFAVAHAERLNTPSSFMLVGGVSATSEMCLTGLESVGAALSDCGSCCRAGRERDLEGRGITWGPAKKITWGPAHKVGSLRDPQKRSLSKPQPLIQWAGTREGWVGWVGC